jgi:cytochrome P450
MQMNDRLLDFYNSIYSYATPECPNVVEISPNGGARFLLTREPEHIKTILTTKFGEYGKGHQFHRVWSPFLGDSIFTTDGQMWSDNRSLIRPMFIKDRVRDLEIFQRWTNALISKIPAGGGTVNMMDLFYRMTLDVTTDFLLGVSVNSLDKWVTIVSVFRMDESSNLIVNSPKHEFVDAFQEVQRIQMQLTILV